LQKYVICIRNDTKTEEETMF